MSHKGKSSQNGKMNGVKGLHWVRLSTFIQVGSLQAGAVDCISCFIRFNRLTSFPTHSDMHYQASNVATQCLIARAAFSRDRQT